MSVGLHFLTIAGAAELIAARKLSPAELVEACLARIAALDDRLNSFVTVTSERARRDARRAEAEIAASGPRTPLHGIPYGLKDIFDVAGVRTTAQSRLLADNIAVEDSACAARLEAAGARVDEGFGRHTVHWPDGALGAFFLFDVLLHELGHHRVQHASGRLQARVMRTRDHERAAALWAGRWRALLD
jgi:hypothetical protein